jgi:hypothetical protein
MAFSGDQPNFKQLDLSVETGTGTNAASGSIMFHATSGLIQHINGDWATMSSSTTLSNISDVQIAGAASGQLIRYDGSQWVLADHDMEAITDLDTSAGVGTANNVLISDGDGTYSFAAMDLSTNVGGDLGDLDDVSTAGAADGKVLAHNGTSFVLEDLTIGDQVDGGLEELNDVDTTTNSPGTTAGLVMVSDGDNSYSFAENVTARKTVSTVTTATSAAVNNLYIVNTSGGAVTVTLPASHTAGDVVAIKCAGSSQTNAITLATADADTIDGASTQEVASNFAAVECVSDGTNWFLV